MQEMFSLASTFNADISKWDVRKVYNMHVSGKNADLFRVSCCQGYARLISINIFVVYGAVWCCVSVSVCVCVRVCVCVCVCVYVLASL